MQRGKQYFGKMVSCWTGSRFTYCHVKKRHYTRHGFRGHVKLKMWVASGNPVVFLVDERVQEVDKVSHYFTTI